jgi:ribonuclease Z
LYHEGLVSYIKGVDLLYYETTYLKDQNERAEKHNHSTTEQAGLMATKAGVKKLLIGHFSSKYENLEPFLTETQAIFSDTILAIEGSCIKV